MLAAFVAAQSYGVHPDLSKHIVPGTDYSKGYAFAALLKAPAIHGSRCTLSAALNAAMPHGSVWWTDISNLRPEDFDGCTYSRLFSVL
jgi:hypothetical protein